MGMSRNLAVLNRSTVALLMLAGNAGRALSWTPLRSSPSPDLMKHLELDGGVQLWVSRVKRGQHTPLGDPCGKHGAATNPNCLCAVLSPSWAHLRMSSITMYNGTQSHHCKTVSFLIHKDRRTTPHNLQRSSLRSLWQSWSGMNHQRQLSHWKCHLCHLFKNVINNLS